MSDVHPAPEAPAPLDRAELARRALMVAAIAISLAVLLIAAWAAAEALFILFASVLLALFLRGLSDALARRTSLTPNLALAIVVLTLAVTLVVSLELLAPTLSAQAHALGEQLPKSLDHAEKALSETRWGALLMPDTSQTGEAPSTGDVVAQAAGISHPIGLVAKVLGGLLNLGISAILILFTGLYLASQPRLYVSGMIRLLPRANRKRGREIADEVGRRLGWWLIGQTILVGIFSAITAAGLAILGMPLALILGVIRGLLNPIPNFGPAIAIVPGLLLALPMGWGQFVRVGVMYLVIQLFETYLITPWVTKRTVDIPPALLVGAQLVLGLLFGFPGLATAAPLTVVAMVLIQKLWSEPVLGNPPAKETLPPSPPPV